LNNYKNHEPSLDGFFLLHDQDWLDKQRVAGQIARQCIKFFRQEVEQCTTKTTLQLSKLAEEIIRDNNCIPTFKGYREFPETTCISINNELVHGIPKDYHLKENDLVSFDIGVTYKGAIADTATTCLFGKSDNQLIKTTKECLNKAIEAIKIDKKIGVIGNVIYKHATNNNFNVITNYGGHFISWNQLHVSFISNKSSIDEGVRIQKGMTFAIEPLICIGDPCTYIGLDGWTVKTNNLNCHEEHTIFVHEDRVEVIT
jgi:methionyl aminopeptidase